MNRFWNRIWTVTAVIVLVGALECGWRVEQSLNVGAYYHELAVEQVGMNPVERAIASLLLAAGDKLQKHKRQAHASLPPVRHIIEC